MGKRASGPLGGGTRSALVVQALWVVGPGPRWCVAFGGMSAEHAHQEKLARHD
jgi:hypothetical protein